MSCSCGQGHRNSIVSGAGTPVNLAQPMIALNGRLICSSTDQMMMALSLLPEHARLSRAEPGCLCFDIHQGDDPMVWHVSELFVNRDAFKAHGARNASSEWGRSSKGIIRDFKQSEISPFLRSEHPGDAQAIEALLNNVFEGPDEAQIVDRLRRDGDLTVSLVLEAVGVILGHIALSPTGGDCAGLALAPLAIAPAVQGLGLGGALVRAALVQARETPVIVVGDPAYYSRFGFVPADLDSPWAGPCIQARGKLPAGGKVTHAAAFFSV